jgi:hypothetical protein
MVRLQDPEIKRKSEMIKYDLGSDSDAGPFQINNLSCVLEVELFRDETVILQFLECITDCPRGQAALSHQLLVCQLHAILEQAEQGP